MGPQALDTTFSGPLPPDTVGLVFGRSSKTLKGLVVHPGVIDSDYTGVVKVMVSSPRGVTVIIPDERIAQLLVLPSCHRRWRSRSAPRGSQGFGSSGDALVNLSVALQNRPMATLTIKGVPFEGLLDTGADVSIIRQGDWPKDWPIQQTSQTLRGLGVANQPRQSAVVLPWQDKEGHQGSFQPYVCPIPVTLWGREVLSAMGLQLSNQFNQVGSLQAWNIMASMGYSGKGIGKEEQGNVDPVSARPKLGRQGLGFQQGPLPNSSH